MPASGLIRFVLGRGLGSYFDQVPPSARLGRLSRSAKIIRVAIDTRDK